MNRKRMVAVALCVILAMTGLAYAEPAADAAEYTSADGFVYTAAEAENEIIVTGIPETDQTLTISPAIDGKTVKYVDAGCIAENVTTVFLPSGTELYHAELLNHEILVYSYKDYEMIHSQNSVMYYFAAVEPGEYALTDANRYYPGGESELLKQEYCDYPAELNGRRLYNCLMKNDYFVLHRGGGCDYYRISDSEVGICHYLGSGTSIKLPEEIDGMTVVAVNSLNSEWVIFSARTTKVTFPSTLKLFGNYVVFTKLVSVIRIPNGVTEIGSYAVKGDRITDISIPASVTTIGVKAFDTKMTSLKLPENVVKLSERAFTNCNYTTINLSKGMDAVPRDLCMNSKRLRQVIIPAAVIRIGSNAFKNCAKINEIKIPADIQEIEAGAFSGCSALNTVNYKGNQLRKIEEETFSGCGFTKVSVFAGVEEIGRRAYAGCEKLMTVEIPDSVLSIGEGAFSGCKKLLNVKISASVKEIADDAFENCHATITFTVPEGSYASQWAESKGFQVKVVKQK